jgi:uncharacterized protein YecT (DUF1311 family)
MDFDHPVLRHEGSMRKGADGGRRAATQWLVENVGAPRGTECGRLDGDLDFASPEANNGNHESPSWLMARNGTDTGAGEVDQGTIAGDRDFALTPDRQPTCIGSRGANPVAAAVEESSMIPNFVRHALLAVLLAGMTAVNANAASFNCAKAAKPDEKAICANPSLSDLDVAMATLYGVRMELPMLMGARGAAQDEQRAFLDKRAACGGKVACITTQYNQRIAELRRTIKDGMDDYCAKLGICG